MMTEILLLVATGCAGLFAGGALYVSLVEHPARVSCGPAIAVAEFGPSYRRSARLQSGLATLCFLAAVSAAFRGAGHGVFIAAVLIVAVIPFTLLVILPTNDRLQSPTLNPAGPEVSSLLTRWGRLHAVRTALGLAAFLILLQAIASPA
jgi:Domain of unknown function (DUF1772)